MPEGEKFSVYLPYTLAQAVHDARRTAIEFNLSEAAAKGIAAALNGHGPADVDHAQAVDLEQLARIERLVLEHWQAHQLERVSSTENRPRALPLLLTVAVGLSVLALYVHQAAG